MDKYKTNTSFNKWFSSINLKHLSKEAKQHIATFNRYVKKFEFETALKLLLHGIIAEKESLRHLDTKLPPVKYAGNKKNNNCPTAQCHMTIS